MLFAHGAKILSQKDGIAGMATPKKRREFWTW
jgi:hypothetical protein